MFEFFSFILAMFVTMALIPLMIPLARGIGIVDLPDPRKVHKQPVPRIGGVAMIIGSFIPILYWGHEARQYACLLLGSGIILIFGVWDDMRTLNYRLKFVGQLAAVLIVVFLGGIRVDYMPLAGLDPIPAWLAYPFTVFALMGVTNAINLADGLDGLAGGTTLLSLTAIAVLSYLAGDPITTVVTLAVMGSIIGFLRFNTHPATVFMGDAGSQFLGFSIGVLTIMLTQQVDRTLSPAIAVLILGLPIMDTLLVMGQRVYEGRSPFKPDKNHIHHKLLDVGFDHYEAVLVIYLVQALLVTGAFFLRYNTDGFILFLYALLFLLIGMLFQGGVSSSFQVRNAASGGERRHRISRMFEQLQRSGFCQLWSYRFVAGSLIAYVLFAVAATRTVPQDIGILAAALSALFAVGLVAWPKSPLLVFERAGVYVALACVVYLLVQFQGLPAPLDTISNFGFAVLAVMVVVAVRYVANSVFVFTTLDFLVVFLVIFIPVLSDSLGSSSWVSAFIAKMFIIFYAAEFVLSKRVERVRSSRAFISAVLAAIAVRGLVFPPPIS